MLTYCLIGPLGNVINYKIRKSSLKEKMHLKISSANRRPFLLSHFLCLTRRFQITRSRQKHLLQTIFSIFLRENHYTIIQNSMNVITSSNGTIFRVTVSSRGESTGHRWILLTKASDAELWCFLWSTPEQTVEQTIDTLVIWDAIALTMMSL